LVGQADLSVERLTHGVLRLSAWGGPVRPSFKALVQEFERSLASVALTGNSARLICPDARGAPHVVTLSPGPPEGIRNVVWVSVERAERLKWSETELRAMHHLTRREASVVIALLEGADIDLAATQLGLSSRSVRTYLSNVYGKMGVSSQVDLMKRLLGPG
jgi:DNA-binding CsgD family transcriptional regulator